MIRARPFLFLLFLLAVAEQGDAFWSPGSADKPIFFGFDTPDPWVQQMRNFKDILRVDAFREPAASTPVGNTATVVPMNFRLHPLSEYFYDVATEYDNFDFPTIADPLRNAGYVIEDLITRRGKNRFRNARILARQLENAVSRTSDSTLFLNFFPGFLEPTPYVFSSNPPAEASHTISYSWDNYRAIATMFAQELRAAARNASIGRPLTRGIRYFARPLSVTKTVTYSDYNTNSLTELTYSDGHGHFSTFVASSTESSSGTSSNDYYTAGGSATLDVLDHTVVTGGTITLFTPTPTPIPSATP